MLGDNRSVSTRVLLIRHAKTDSASRLCGWFDISLAPAGHAQLSALLQRHPTQAIPDALLTSTLRRAKEVAIPLGRAWALEPQPADWAREIHCGHAEGMSLEQLQREFPEHWIRNHEQTDSDFAWPGGESCATFRARVLAGLNATVAAHAGRRVAVVTHAGVISQVLGVIRHRPASVWALDRPDPLTATEITWDDGVPTAILTYNDSDWF